MTLLIILFGVLITMAGIVIIINPETLFGFLRNNSEKLVLQVLAVGARVVLGLLLIYQSSESRYPLVIEVIGWISLAAALFLAVIGRRNFSRLMSWALSFVKPYGRLGGILAAAFGVFLVHAYI
jgi:hypothetical protein